MPRCGERLAYDKRGFQHCVARGEITVFKLATLNVSNQRDTACDTEGTILLSLTSVSEELLP